LPKILADNMDTKTTVVLASVLILIQLVFSGVLFAACGDNPSREESTITVGKDQNGQEIAVRSGDTIEVQLKGMGGTGYWWYLDDLPVDYLELVSEKTTFPEGRAGAPVTGVWRLKAKEPGHTQIKMDYYRKWEGIRQAADHFVITINIGE
jgi:predicted secreted protein